MSDFTDKVTALEAVLDSSTTFDGFLMDRAFMEQSGLDLGQLDPKLRKSWSAC